MTTRITKPSNAPVNIPITWNTSGDIRYAIVFEGLPFDSVAGARLGVKRYVDSTDFAFEATTANELIDLSEDDNGDLVLTVLNDAPLPALVGTVTLVLDLIDGSEWVVLQSTATGTKGTL